MGVLVFFLLHWAKALNSEYDCYWVALLVALEAPHWILLWAYRHPR